MPIDYMFGGFSSINLVTKDFDYFNGFRITMRQPEYPCKLGVFLSTNLKEYEHFVAHLVDVAPPVEGQEAPFVEYEIPLRLMVHNVIRSRLI
jgi:hypothetical protein